MTIVTRVDKDKYKEVKDVIHTVVKIANDRGSASQNHATLESDEVDATGSGGRNGNRSVAYSSHFVEFFKHHLNQVTTEARNHRMCEELTLNVLAVKVDKTLYQGSLKMKVRTPTASSEVDISTKLLVSVGALRMDHRFSWHILYPARAPIAHPTPGHISYYWKP